MSAQQHATVTEGDEGIRLDRWFKRHYAQLPHAMLEKYLRKGQIRLDGKKAKSSDRLAIGQLISYPELEVEVAPKKPRRTLSPHDAKEVQSWVLYKDERLIVLNKPQGLAVQGGTKIARSLDDLLDGLMFDYAERPKLIHRIDRDTSGALVLARSAKVAAQLAKGFAGKTIEKTYWALVVGQPLPGEGSIELPLAKVASDFGRELVGVDEDEGKFARTEFRTLDSLARKFALLELKPVTGRMHQLRVHCASIGHPILGDHKYGGGNTDAENLGVQNVLHLHARRIDIPAFGGGKSVTVIAPLPPHMVASFRALGLDVPKK